VTPGDGDHTFVFADLAGFTALTETHGDERAVDLADEFCIAIRRLLSDRGAEEVKTLGDAMMIKVAAAADAITLGLAILEETRELPHFPEVRVGMHTGPAVERAGDWFGATVNVAARVAAAAQGNEVLLTGATRAAAGELEGVKFEGRGAARLRNVREEVRLVRAVRADRRAERLPVDPVCRMTVGAEHAAGRLRHEGREYHFCSLECTSAFAADPARYVEEEGA
jgi:adenylate cyclase